MPFSMLADVREYLLDANPGLLSGIDEYVQYRAALMAYKAHLVFFLYSVYFVLRWTYRVNQNARQLAADKTIAPAWAVGWYFIPIAHFWKPFQAMRETWQIATDATNWRSVAVPGLLRMWWIFWVIGSILILASELLPMRFSSLAIFMVGDVLSVAGSVAGIVSALVLIRIIKEITRRQMVVNTTSTVFD